MSSSPWCGYRRHFEHNQIRPLPPVPEAMAAELVPHRAAAVARVLARFQLGEAGEGRIARDIHRIHLPGIDADYRRALELFVKEEGRHARILAALVRRLGGRLLSHKASNDLFRWCRRLLGLRFKLLTLLVAEVVGGEVYATVAGTGGPALRAALAEIAADEDHHLGFHADFLRVTFGRGPSKGPVRFAGRCALWAVGLAALLVVLLENGRDLRTLALGRRALAARVVGRLRIAVRASFGGKTRSALALAEVQP
jgi:hypothetical protein